MTRFVKQLAVMMILGLALVVAPDPARAQPAAAIGRPLPDGTLAKGTISVRIVAGSPSSPVVGSDVTLLVNGQPRVARTDAAGRATFGGLPVGAMAQAKIVDADKKEISSETFPVPDDGGTRLMLSTKPFEGTGGMPAEGAMPEARQMSGQPRPDRNLPAGTFVVRLTYNNLSLKDGKSTDTQPPVGVHVYLVAYGSDDSIKVTKLVSDAEGNATFTDLDVSGAVSYFALAALPRNGGHDRLISVPTVLDPQGGARVVLSGDKRDATSPAIDDYGKLIPSDASTVTANRVRISIDGVGEPGTPVTLYDAATMKPVGVANTQRGAPDPSQVRGSANYSPRPDLAAGTLEVEIKGGSGSASLPLSGIEIRLVGADNDAPIANGVGTTGMDGKVRITIKPDPKVKAVLMINGKQMLSSGMELLSAGGKLDVTAQWPAQGKPEAVFEVADNVGPILYAQTVMSGQLFRSLPIQTVPGVGMRANIYVYPRTLFTFDTHSFVEDQLLAVQGMFEVSNYSWAPYKAGPDGLLIKLPRHHKGAIIGAADQSEVAVAVGEGFKILRPIPPGGRKFRAGYSMPIEDGEVDWKFELPLGTWQSEMKIRTTPGMTVKLPQGVEGATQTAATGEPWFVVTNITIDRGQSIEISISGFPTEAAWRVWAPRIVGILVLVMVLGGIGFALQRTSSTDPALGPGREARRAKLLDELVDLERRGVSTTKERHRKEQLIDELERLWGA
ncbi:MAG: hypothetical protein H0T42_31065 [Deltaproteobacteria bacterium]|nr:hypothetical protein [Deltaproteobacteria bacterium]